MDSSFPGSSSMIGTCELSGFVSRPRTQDLDFPTDPVQTSVGNFPYELLTFSASSGLDRLNGGLPGQG